MFAKFSPDGGRVAYVREHDLYVERLADGQITPLTHDGSRHDDQRHVRLGLRGGAEDCATDSAGARTAQRIAYWQLDASGVRDFLLINDTDSLYSFVTPVQYPKAGTTNSAARIGVVSAARRTDDVARRSRATRATSTSRAWTGRPGPNELLVQQLNRRQTQNTFWSRTRASGAARTVCSSSATARGWTSGRRRDWALDRLARRQFGDSFG